MTDTEKKELKEKLRELQTKRIWWLNEAQKLSSALNNARSKVSDLDVTIEKLIGEK